MSEAPEPVGTDPNPGSTPPSDAGDPGATPAAPTIEELQRQLGELQGKYESQLDRYNGVEQRAHTAESRIDQLIANRLGEDRSTGGQGVDEFGEAVQWTESQLSALAQSDDANTRRWAKDQQAQRQFLRNLPEMITRAVALSQVDEPTRKEIESLQSEYQKRGERVSIETAKAILGDRRKLSDLEGEIAKLKTPTPHPAPAGTALSRAGAAPLAAGEMDESEYRRRMATLPDPDRLALKRSKDSGALKVRRPG